MPIELIIYVVVMIYIILGCGSTFSDTAKWAAETSDRISGRIHFKETLKAVLTWPWFDIKKLRDKYSP